MLKRMNLSGLLVLLWATGFSVSAHAASSARLLHAKRFHARHLLFRTDAVNDREQDGLVGSVRRVRTETAKIVSKEGKMVEGPRVVLETATYDIKGAKIDTAYFLAAGGTLTGKEVYKYDDKGNMVEMSLHRDDGSLASKEVYTYEFDAVGNWTKMTTSVAILEGGKVTFEPTEVTYRVIAYYMEEATVNKLSQPAATTPAANASTAANAPAVNAPAASSANSASNSAQTATLRTASFPNTNAPAVQPNVAPSNAASQPGRDASLKSSAFVPAASVPAPVPAAAKNAPASNKKPASASSAPPELSAVDSSKVLAVSSPSVAGSANAATGGSSAPQMKVEGEAPSRPITRGPLKPVSGGVLNGKALSLPAPVYPDTAKRFRAAGVVTVAVVIDVTGRVISAKATDGSEMLHQAAEKAALRARFSPTLLSGQPVKVSGIINYNFSLNN